MAVYNGPSGHGSWQYYNFYGPYANAFTSKEAQDSFNLSLSSAPEAQQPFVPSRDNVIKTITLKVLSPSNKRDFTVFTLRDVAEEDIETPDSLKEVIIAQIGDAVSSKPEFPLGYYRKSEKVWINNEHDVRDAIQLLKESGKMVLWCLGQDQSSVSGKKRERSGNDDICCPAKKKSSASEERTSRVNDLKTQLRSKHGSTYSSVQYAMWAEMLVGGGHESMDEPLSAPMFGTPRARGKGSFNMSEAFTTLAGSIANALSPKQVNLDSPTKSVTLRGKYMEQLRDMVSLREIGALTEEEYQEQRCAVVNLMRKLN